MAENTSENKKGSPTEKMVESAKKAAERHAVKLPKDCLTDYDVCKVFLDTYLNKPTPKALAFGEKIARDKGVEIPPEARATARELSVWIDANKA